MANSAFTVGGNNTVPGQVVQVQSTTLTSSFTTITAASTFVDVPGLAVTITPTSINSKILVFWNVCAATGSADNGFLQAVRDSTPICVGDAAGLRTQVSNTILRFTADAGAMSSSSNNFLDSPGTTSPTTYKIQVANNDGSTTICVNQTNVDANSPAWSRAASTITVMEIAG